MSELTKDKVTTLVNHFVRLSLKYGVPPSNCDIALIKHDDGWSLEMVARDDHDIDGLETRFPMPELPDKSMDAAIELAGFLSVKLNNYIRVKRSNHGRTAEARSRAAKIAAEARWKKRDVISKKRAAGK